MLHNNSIKERIEIMKKRNVNILTGGGGALSRP